MSAKEPGKISGRRGDEPISPQQQEKNIRGAISGYVDVGKQSDRSKNNEFHG